MPDPIRQSLLSDVNRFFQQSVCEQNPKTWRVGRLRNKNDLADPRDLN